jgi:hypothetical protein
MAMQTSGKGRHDTSPVETDVDDLGIDAGQWKGKRGSEQRMIGKDCGYGEREDSLGCQ